MLAYRLREQRHQPSDICAYDEGGAMSGRWAEGEWSGRGAAQAGTVVMDTTFPSAYEQIMDKAKGLSVRTFALANAVVGNAVVGAPRA